MSLPAAVAEVRCRRGLFYWLVPFRPAALTNVVDPCAPLPVLLLGGLSICLLTLGMARMVNVWRKTMAKVPTLVDLKLVHPNRSPEKLGVGVRTPRGHATPAALPPTFAFFNHRRPASFVVHRTFRTPWEATQERRWS